MVSIEKLGSWFLLLVIGYTLVSLVNAPRRFRGETPRRDDAATGGMSVPTL
ncbi:hypothetical protein [Bradyrhizobium sp. UFLA03-84]|uniref:hypothetical protein n=1 Tax=Bradyrhizobium sp. UFLA03-84 TaxID=418599 RepID=UPI00269B8507